MNHSMDSNILPRTQASRDLPLSVLNNLIEGCQVIGPDFRYLYVNDAVTRQGKTRREALLGHTMMECYPGIENTEMFSILLKCMEERTPATMENVFDFPDGSKGCFELRFEPVPEGVAILSVDITDRKRTQSALERTHRALTIRSRCNRTLVHATDEQQFIQDVCDLIVESGGYCAAWIEVHRDSGASQSEQHTKAMAWNMDSISETIEPTLAFDIRPHDTSIGTFTIRAEEPNAFDDDECALLQEIAMDLGHGIETLRARDSHSRTEKQLIAAQRLEAVGRLAGGIAHDFNNLLSVILTYADFAGNRLHKSDPVRDDIDQIREAGERATVLTRQLLAFGRKQFMESQVTSLNEVIGGIQSMLCRLLGEDIEIAVVLGDDLGNVVADRGQLEQVIMNLAVNARDAMPRGGKLTIETDNVDLLENYADEHAAVEPGRYVRMSVTDTGMGMDPEIRSRIFEPFFTTKEKGKGTGLGLSMVYGIVKQSCGNIWVYSEPDQGTTFKIYLPRVDEPVSVRAAPRSKEMATGHETILLVEDEPSVRKAIDRILSMAGYRVLTAANGGEALLVCETHQGVIDLMLTDVIMPKMSGGELAERLKKLYPNLKVLFASGYTDNAIADRGILTPGTRFLAKPFTVAELTSKVREVLEDQE